MNTERSPKEEGSGTLHKGSKAFRVLFFSGLGLVFIGFLAWGGYIALKIVNGQGLDHYWTGWGVRFNYIGALILIVCAGAVSLAAPLLYWWCARHERDFKRKYGIEENKE